MKKIRPQRINIFHDQSSDTVGLLQRGQLFLQPGGRIGYAIPLEKIHVVAQRTRVEMLLKFPGSQCEMRFEFAEFFPERGEFATFIFNQKVDNLVQQPRVAPWSVLRDSTKWIFYQGRTASCPTAPLQIQACRITAPGSSVLLALHASCVFSEIMAYSRLWQLKIIQ